MVDLAIPGHFNQHIKRSINLKEDQTAYEQKVMHTSITANGILDPLQWLVHLAPVVASVLAGQMVNQHVSLLLCIS